MAFVGGVAGGGGAFVVIMGGIAVMFEAAMAVAVACAGRYASCGALTYATRRQMSSKPEAQSEWYNHLHESLTKCVGIVEGQQLQVR